jgi:hypothetical protein
MLPPPALHLEESARSEAADDATDSTPTKPRIVFTNVRVSRSAIQIENPQVVMVPEHGGVAPRALSPPAAPATLRPPVLHLGHGDVEPPLVPPAPRLPAPLPTRNSPIVMSLLVLLGACGGILYYLFG